MTRTSPNMAKLVAAESAPGVAAAERLRADVGQRGSSAAASEQRRPRCSSRGSLTSALSQPHARIEPRVAEVDERGSPTRTRARRPIVRPTSTGRSRPSAADDDLASPGRAVEDGLGEDRGADERAEVDADEGDHRDHRVAQRVCSGDLAARCRPLARAVRMKSAWPTSSMVVRVSRVTMTVDTDASTMAGSTRYWNCSARGDDAEVPLVGPDALHREPGPRRPVVLVRVHAGDLLDEDTRARKRVWRSTIAAASVVTVSANEYLRTAARARRRRCRSMPRW